MGGVARLQVGAQRTAGPRHTRSQYSRPRRTARGPTEGEITGATTLTAPKAGNHHQEGRPSPEEGYGERTPHQSQWSGS